MLINNLCRPSINSGGYFFKGANNTKITTVKGTRDYLLNEMALRDYMQNKILEEYQKSGFHHIGTPILEDAENLDKSDGRENLNLIFKVLKK